MNTIDELRRTCAPAKDWDFGLRCTSKTSFCGFTTITLADCLGVDGTLDGIATDVLPCTGAVADEVNLRRLRELERSAEVSPASVHQNDDDAQLTRR